MNNHYATALISLEDKVQPLLKKHNNDNWEMQFMMPYIKRYNTSDMCSPKLRKVNDRFFLI